MRTIQPNETLGAIPDKLSEMAKSPTARKARATMSKDMWQGYWSKDQRKTGLSQKDKENLMLAVAKEWNLKWALSQVDVF